MAEQPGRRYGQEGPSGSMKKAKAKAKVKEQPKPRRIIGYCADCRVIYVLTDKTGHFALCSACNVLLRKRARGGA